MLNMLSERERERERKCCHGERQDRYANTRLATMATRREGSRLLLEMACGKGQRVERGGRLGTLAPVPRERVYA